MPACLRCHSHTTNIGRGSNELVSCTACTRTRVCAAHAWLRFGPVGQLFQIHITNQLRWNNRQYIYLTLERWIYLWLSLERRKEHLFSLYFWWIMLSFHFLRKAENDFNWLHISDDAFFFFFPTCRESNADVLKWPFLFIFLVLWIIKFTFVVLRQ